MVKNQVTNFLICNWCWNGRFRLPVSSHHLASTSCDAPGTAVIMVSALFFPRVRTPCGHGAQVIVEGREEQTDGGERNKDPKTNPKPNTQARRPKLHHLVVFPLHWVRHVKRKLVAINGPEFSKEKDGSASCVHGKPPRRLQTDFPSRILVTSGHTTVWQNKVTLQVSVSRCSSAGCNQVDQE